MHFLSILELLSIHSASFSVFVYCFNVFYTHLMISESKKKKFAVKFVEKFQSLVIANPVNLDKFCLVKRLMNCPIPNSEGHRAKYSIYLYGQSVTVLLLNFMFFRYTSIINHFHLNTNNKAFA